MKTTQHAWALGLMLLFSATWMQAQEVMNLWKTNPPTCSELTQAETRENNGSWITNVSVPQLFAYPAKATHNTGMAVVICPGGGYAGLAIEHEGHQFAQWLNSQGISAFVLKYRMPNHHKYVPLEDAQQAIRYVRQHAQEYGIDPHQIGISGFSAGGHLASTASTHFTTDGISTRPDFSILFYPVITMGIPTHGGSRYFLLGDQPEQPDLDLFSNEKQVTANTPPAILLLSSDDTVVPPVNSRLYYEALLAHQVPAAMYVFPEGDHGWGMNIAFKYHAHMLSLLKDWLADIRAQQK